MANLVKELQVYHAADMLMQGLKEYRIKQKEEMEGIVGIKVFDPSSQPFNNKKETSSFKLSERIVESDTQAIEESDIYVIDLPVSGNGGLGTNQEAAQIFQMKRDAKRLFDKIGDVYGFSYKLGSTKDDYDFNEMEVTPDHIELLRDCLKTINKKCLLYSSDIRWNTTDMKDHMDRVPYSFNAYTYGVALALTNGEGVISWEEVLKRLENIFE